MRTRFHVDLLHPGWVAHTWQQWFIGPKGARRLAWFALGGVAALVAIEITLIWPTSRRMSADRDALPALQRTLATRDADLGVFRSNLQALANEAKRQVRWADLLTTFSQQITPALKLQLAEAGRAAPPSASPPQAPGTKVENTLRIDAITPLRPGSPPLVEAAQFIAGLMRDPTVNKRFELKSWEVKPGAQSAPGGQQFLGIAIVLAERPQ